MNLVIRKIDLTGGITVSLSCYPLVCFVITLWGRFFLLSCSCLVFILVLLTVVVAFDHFYWSYDPPDCYFAIMEGSSQPSHLSHPSSPSRPNEPSSPGAKKTTKETLPKQSEERGEPNTPMTSFIGANWPSLPLESGSPIQPGQAAKATSQQMSPWKIWQKDPEEYEKDQVGKYADYFKGNEILPILEILQKLEPRIVSLVVTDLKTRWLVGFKKEGFEDLIIVLSA